MKIQCDVCSAEEASVFCCSDEAVLCGPCDRRVHCTNKLAGKHPRLSLLHPDSHAPTLCDICQEKRGLLFCHEDRAMLCRDCDSSIHNANQPLSAKHSRFLLTGVRLSSSRLPAIEAEAATGTSSSSTSSSVNHVKVVEAKVEDQEALCTISNTNNSSSISEYLTKTLPGWHVEDFLFDDDDATANSTAEAVAAAENSSYHDQVDFDTLDSCQPSSGMLGCFGYGFAAKEASHKQKRKRQGEDVSMVPRSLSERLQ